MAKEKDTKVKEDKEAEDNAKLLAEAKAFGITKSRVSTSGFKHKKPEELEKENKRLAKLSNERLKVRVEAAKILAKMKPIDIRKALLVSRFKAVRSKTRPRAYTDNNIVAWLEELNLINTNPKSWNKLTNHGKIPFVPGNRKKMTAREKLEAMDLD